MVRSLNTFYNQALSLASHQAEIKMSAVAAILIWAFKVFFQAHYLLADLISLCL